MNDMIRGLIHFRSLWTSSFRGRLATFALVLAALAVVIVVIDTAIWHEQNRLQEGFIAIKAEKFYFGVKFRSGVRNLNAILLDYYLTGKKADLALCRREAEDLQGWLAAKKDAFVAAGEQTAFAHLERAYGDFLARIAPLLKFGGSAGADPGQFAATYERVRQYTGPLLEACNDVVEAERISFDRFLSTSDQALVWVQRWFLLSLILLLGLAASLGVLVYRGLLAPLHARLTESQALLQRQEKLAALGALAAGVAHEIRNPLTAIKFRLFSLRKSLPMPFADSEDSRVISGEIDRLDRIVRDFLQFARPSEPNRVRVPAERILTEVRDLMQPEMEDAGIHLQLEVVQPAWIRADTQQLKQVLINLVRNSAESIQSKGAITLRLDRGTAGLGGSVHVAAVLAVIDTGKGIPPEVQKRLFDPFFTTKEGGTGLGLAIAARIVEKHGGVMQYKTEQDRGTIFEVVLPALEEHATANTAHRR